MNTCGDWCNGSTRGCGPLSEGSTPLSPPYYLYEIFNTETLMYYIGIRCHSNPSLDRYMGSSNLLKKGGWHYGKFYEPVRDQSKLQKRIILKKIESRQVAENLEKQYILKYRQKYGREKIYNQSDGGSGGNLGEIAQEKRKKTLSTEESKQRRSSLHKKINQEKLLKDPDCFTSYGTLGKSWKDKNKGMNKKGKKNSQYGTHWYTNGSENVKAKECPEGFYRGRSGNFPNQFSMGTSLI